MYFLITIRTANKKYMGIRTRDFGDIETAWIFFRSLAVGQFGDKMISYDCVQLSQHSELVKEYEANKRRRGGKGKVYGVKPKDWE